jgi:hypothetical protein
MGTKLYLSLAHSEAVCEAFLDHFDAVLSEATVRRLLARPVARA